MTKIRFVFPWSLSVSADSLINDYIGLNGHQTQTTELSMKWKVCQAVGNMESEAHTGKRKKMKKTIHVIYGMPHKV